jgi:hypothetical protein
MRGWSDLLSSFRKRKYGSSRYNEADANSSDEDRQSLGERSSNMSKMQIRWNELLSSFRKHDWSSSVSGGLHPPRSKHPQSQTDWLSIHHGYNSHDDTSNDYAAFSTKEQG